jgi:xRRM domain
LKSPLHAQILVDHFTRDPKKQTHGLDDIGTAVDPHTDAIIMEIVRGRREELYWEKVPEKVRRKAVLESVRLAEFDAGGGGEDGTDGEKGVPESRRRKKRKIGE